MLHEIIKKGDAVLLWLGGKGAATDPMLVRLNDDPHSQDGKNYYANVGNMRVTHPLEWMQEINAMDFARPCIGEPTEKEMGSARTPESWINEGDAPLGFIPFRLSGSLSSFEDKYLAALQETVYTGFTSSARNLLSSIWLFANHEWGMGYKKPTGLLNASDAMFDDVKVFEYDIDDMLQSLERFSDAMNNSPDLIAMIK